MRRVGNVQAGNSIVLTLLLVLVITVIGASGWFVYQHNRTRAPHAAASPHQTTTSQPSTPVPKHTIQEGVGLSVSDTLKDWSGTKSKFQIRIADGWKLMELQNPGEITILWSNTNDLAITPGSTSQILQTDDAFTDTSPNAPLEITLGISSEGFPRGKDVGTIKTAQGLVITKRLANKQINADELPDGFDLNYEYFMEHGALVLICDYRIKTGQTDYHENVEKMLQTLTVTQDAS